MKYLLLLLLFTGCIYKPNPAPVTETPKESDAPTYDMIVKIRNCEYIRSRGFSSSADFYVHCGDCTNPIHSKP